jgi:hypothetical protein
MLANPNPRHAGARRRAFLAPGFVLILLAASCGCHSKPPALGEVEGTLTWQNVPLANVQVEFIPDAEHGTTGPRSTGITDANGHFVLRCDDQRPGAVIGQHVVVLQEVGGQEQARERDPRGRRSQNPAADGAAPAEQAEPIPSMYKTAGTTPLKEEVKPGSQTINLEL